MKKVVWRGSLAGVFLYASVGVFGYLTFYDNPKELEKKNILLTPYGSNVAIIIVSQNCPHSQLVGLIHLVLLSVHCHAPALPALQGNSGGDIL
jgi:amino acid permease